MRYWRTCEDCGGLLVYDKADVDKYITRRGETFLTEVMDMNLPKRVVEVLEEAVRRWPELANGDDNARRELIKRAGEQIVFHLGIRWGNKKRQGLSDAFRSKDSIAYIEDDNTVSIWDCFNGATRAIQVREGSPPIYSRVKMPNPDIEFMPLQSVDHFGWNTVPEPGPVDPPPPPPPPVIDSQEKLIAALDKVSALLEKLASEGIRVRF